MWQTFRTDLPCNGHEWTIRVTFSIFFTIHYVITKLPYIFSILAIHRAIVDLLKGNKREKGGRDHKAAWNLPNSYATDVRKFLDDTYTSLECHSKKYNQACEQIIREFETSFEAWKRISDIKEHGDKMPNHKAELREHFNEFEENVNPWMAATCQLR